VGLRVGFGIAPAPVEVLPGVSDYLKAWLQGVDVPGPAAARFSGGESPRSGSAWPDERFHRELVDTHRRLRASRASLENLEELAGGAPCVITGQQPTLLGGPLYSVWKIAGAVGLARTLSQRWQRKVVPVYWCGADDADFEEARVAWVEDASGRPMRARLPAKVHRAGEVGGGVAGEEVAPVETAALQSMREELRWWEKSGFALPPSDLDLGERTQAQFLETFADAGLVVVDARSSRLKELGWPLFAKYMECHEEIAEAAGRRGDLLEEGGFGRPVSAVALQSALFRLEGNRRVKIRPGEFAAIEESQAATLSPSVLLRPPWQDAVLAPVAQVLGPAELLYHAQLAPVYPILEVQASAPAPRPHCIVWPRELDWPAAPEEQRALLAGGGASHRQLARTLMPRSWKAQVEELRREVGEAAERFAGKVGEVADAKPLRRALSRMRGAVEGVEQALERESLKRREVSVGPEFLAPGGKPQERIFSWVNGWKWWGEDYAALLHFLADRYAQDLLDGRTPGYRVLRSMDHARPRRDRE